MNDEIEYLRKVYQSEETSTWVNKLQMKSIVDYADKLQSNWRYLREWLEEQIKSAKKCKEWNNKKGFFDIDYDRDIKMFEFILDKMNELEKGEKQNDLFYISFIIGTNRIYY